jgi:hypothetical protein
MQPSLHILPTCPAHFISYRIFCTVITRWLVWNTLFPVYLNAHISSSLTPRRSIYQFIFFLPAKKVSTSDTRAVLIVVVGMLLPTVYQVSGFSLGRLPTILISSVPPGKCQDSGLPRLCHSHFFYCKISLLFHSTITLPRRCTGYSETLSAT